MLTVKTIICIFSVIALFIAGRIRKSYEPKRRPLLEKFCITIGAAGIISFGGMFVYNRQFVYAIPKMLLLLSFCLYVYFKRRKKCCVPFWRSIKLTAITSIICFMIDVANRVIINFENAGKPLQTESSAFLIITCMVIVVTLTMLVDRFFKVILNRRRVSSFYY